MKKTLFITLIMSFCLVSFSQDLKQSRFNIAKVKQNIVNDQNVSLGPVQHQKAITSLIDISTSLNGYTILTGTKMAVDQESGTALYIARGGGAMGETGNDIKHTLVDLSTYEFTNIVTPSNGDAKRYPGGTFMKYEDKTFVVSTGPVTEASGWTKNFYFVQNVNNADEKFYTTKAMPADITGLYEPNTVVALTTGEVFFVGRLMATNYYSTHIAINIEKWEWNDEETTLDYVSTTQVATQSQIDTTGCPGAAASAFNIAFSKDGSVGYIWTIGKAKNPEISGLIGMYPVVWKTTDKGDTWNRLPAFDFSTVQGWKAPENFEITNETGEIVSDYTLPLYSGYLWPITTDPDIVIPFFFYGYTKSEAKVPGTVDADGNLHLMVNVQGRYSNHPDSISYTYNYELSKFYDLYTTSTGWDAKFIDTLLTEVNYGTDTPIFGDFDLDHRPHILKSDDGTHIFATWTDSDIAWVDDNTMPNLHVWAYNLENGANYAADFSTGTDYEAIMQYANAPDIAYFDGTEFHIPVVIIDGADPDEEITHQYVKDINIPAVNVGIKEQSTSTTAINCYPNPTDGMTTIAIKTTKTTNLQINIVNLMGQVVYSENKGTVAEGSHKFNFDASKLNSGLYFCTIKAGNETFTSKIIVK